MIKIVFNSGEICEAVFKAVKEGVIELIGDNVENLTGFKAYTMKNEYLGDYSEYRTKYNIYTEVTGGIRMSTGQTEPAPPIPPKPKTKATVTFQASDGGTVEGTLIQKVAVGSDTSKLNIPTPVPDEKKEFVAWTPEIAGVINDDITYTAIFQTQHKYTLEGRVENVEMSNDELVESSTELLYEISLLELAYPIE